MYTDQHTYTQIDIHIHRPTDIYTDRQTYTQTDIHIHRPTYMYTDQHTCTQTKIRVHRPTYIYTEQRTDSYTEERLTHFFTDECITVPAREVTPLAISICDAHTVSVVSAVRLTCTVVRIEVFVCAREVLSRIAHTTAAVTKLKSSGTTSTSPSAPRSG